MKHRNKFSLLFCLLISLLQLSPSILKAVPCDHLLNFAGFNSYIDCGPAIALHPETGVTVEAWIYPFDASLNQKIAGNIDPFTNSGYELAIDSNKLYCEIKDTSGLLTFFRAGQINSNEWTHVAFSFLVNGTMKGYINGNEVFSTSVGSTPIGNTGTTNFIIGSAPWDQTYFNFYGNIDEVKVFNVQLPITAIREDMRLSFTGPTQHLIGYWKFSEGSGNSTADFSGMNNNGTLSGSTLPAWVYTDGPYGIGSSELKVISCCSTFNFDPATIRLDVNVGSLTGSDTVVATFIQCEPGGTQPSGSVDYVYGYWVLDHYGNPNPFTGTFDFNLGAGIISSQDESNPSNLKLYLRNANDVGNWGIWSSATSASSLNGTIHFNAASLSQQYVIGTTGNSPLNTSSLTTNLNGFELSPNPVQNQLNITFSGSEKTAVQLEILDETGRIVLNVSSASLNSERVTLDLNQLQAGMYFMRMNDGENLTLQKFIKN
ncbi:MAG: LamG-like jellyroll fold domain-containing protein [Bacteroidia bacterium]